MVKYINPDDTHPPESDIELFCRARLAEPELRSFEEHLLVCNQCQDAVTDMDRWIRGLPNALKKVNWEYRPFWDRLVSNRKIVWTAAAFGSLAFVMLLPDLVPRPNLPAQDVKLTATRGSETSIAQADRPIDLKLDINGMEDSSVWNVQIVDAAGTQVQQMRKEPANGKVECRVNGLRRGQYWVRLYPAKDAANLGREFSLTVR
jgi:hypothetical protein